MPFSRPVDPPPPERVTVHGDRSVLDRYAGEPWPSVIPAAVACRDGLTISSDERAEPGRFVLHEIHTRTWGAIAGLLSQGW